MLTMMSSLSKWREVKETKMIATRMAGSNQDPLMKPKRNQFSILSNLLLKKLQASSNRKERNSKLST